MGFLSGFNLTYTNGDHSILQAGAVVGVSLVGGNIRVTINAIIRDNNADDPRAGSVDAVVMFVL